MTIWIECDDGAVVNFDHYDGLIVHKMSEPMLVAGVALTHKLSIVRFDRNPDGWAVAKGPEDAMRALLAWIRDQLISPVIGNVERSNLIQVTAHPAYAALLKALAAEEGAATEDAAAARARELLRPGPHSVEGGRRGD